MVRLTQILAVLGFHLDRASSIFHNDKWLNDFSIFLSHAWRTSSLHLSFYLIQIISDRFVDISKRSLALSYHKIVAHETWSKILPDLAFIVQWTSLIHELNFIPATQLILELQTCDCFLPFFCGTCELLSLSIYIASSVWCDSLLLPVI